MPKYDYDVIIIGAGIGGLTAGNILAKNGLKVLIVEKNHVPGGAVTTFYKKGYPIDICHSLCAMKKGAFLRKLFDYLGIYSKFDFIELEKPFISFSSSQNKPFYCYSNFNKYSETLETSFPSEHTNISNLLNEIKGIWEKEILNTYYDPPFYLLALYPVLFPRLFKYRNDTFGNFIDKFTRIPALKEVFSVAWPYLGLKSDKVSALYMVCLFGAYFRDGSYFVKGGIGKISEILADNFKLLGGEISYNNRIEEIILNNKNIAHAIKDSKKNIYFGSKIISNIDSKRTFFNLLDKNVLPSRFLTNLGRSSLSCSAIQIHIVAEADINNEFSSTGTIVLPSCNDLERKIKKLLNLDIQYDSNAVFAISINYLKDFNILKENGEVVFNVVWLPANYDLWEKLAASYDQNVYNDIKAEISNLVISELKKIWTIRKVSFINVLTPISLESWLNSSKGALYDIAATPQQILYNRLKQKTVIKNLNIVGAKSFPGAGIGGAVCSAIFLSDQILKGKLTNKRFKISC